MTPPDKISEAAASLRAFHKKIRSQYSEAYDRNLETLIQAATTPAAVVTVDEMCKVEVWQYKGMCMIDDFIDAIAKKYAGRAIIITAENALPDKPMTQDEIIKLIKDSSYVNYMTAKNILKNLKSANCLYVKED